MRGSKMAEHWNGGSGGKGSRPRPYSVTQEEFGDRFEAIFGKKKKKTFECGDCSWKGVLDETLPNEDFDKPTCPSCGMEL